MKSKNVNPKNLISTFVIMMTLLFFSCEKDPLEDCRKDPACEYFTCKVNGDRWEPNCDEGPLFGCTPWDVQYYKNIPALDMYIDNENIKQRFTLLVRDYRLKLGNNNLFAKNFIETSFSNGNRSSNCIIYVINTLKAQSLKISKIDSINHYITGTFHFVGKNDCGEEVHITDGEFNLPYRF